MPELDIVQVEISVQDNIPTAQNFGVPLILACHDNFVGVREYQASPSGLAQMITDGFTAGHAAYRKAAAICSQSPHCKTFKVANRAATNAQALVFTPTITTVGREVGFDIDVGGTVTKIRHTIVTGTAAAIATALDTLCEAVTGVTSSDNTGTFTIEPDTDEERIYVRNVLGFSIDDTSADAGIATDLAAAAAIDNDWFGLVIDSTSAAEIAAAGAWCLTNRKLFAALSGDDDNLASGTGVSDALKKLLNHFTIVLVSHDLTGCGEAGILGRMLSRTPGSYTWANKPISGQVADAWTGAQISGARANNALLYVSDSGVNLTLDGKCASGRYADVTRGIEWLKSAIRTAVLTVLVTSEKVPYTDTGISQVLAAVSGVCTLAERNGLLASGWSVTAPKVADVTVQNKAARKLPDVKIDGILQGAVQSVILDGTLRL